MNQYKYFWVALGIGWLMGYTPLTQADSAMQLNRNVSTASKAMLSPPLSYDEKIADKGLNALSNLTTGTLEIPKSVINTMNQSNFFYGLVGGFVKGIVNMLGRMGCGVADLITLPIITQPMISPLFVWNDFDKETTYGEVMRLDNGSK
jgi:putative exosortase-associated protein (TIGR04073 family)